MLDVDSDDTETIGNLHQWKIPKAQYSRQLGEQSALAPPL